MRKMLVIWAKREEGEQSMESTRLIQKLYMDLIEKVDETDEIYIEMKEELLEILKEDKEQMGDNEYKRYRDKIFRIAEIGEEKGFVRGFRFAFQLFLECVKE